MNSNPPELLKKPSRSPTRQTDAAAQPHGLSHSPTAGAPKARIVVVEDNAFVRKGVVTLINRQLDLICCGEAESMASARLLIAEQKPHLVVLDLRLPDGESFELMTALRLRAPEVRI